MKKFLIIVLYLFNIHIIAQVESQVVFDPNTGNFNITYQGDSTVINLVFEPSTKIKPFIKSKVIYLNSFNKYKYSYIIHNDSTSIQRLYDFHIDIFSSISDIERPDTTWNPGFFSYIPVFHWFNSIEESGLASPLDGILPGTTLNHFSFSSLGLPSISFSYFQGNPISFLTFPEEPPNDLEELLDSIERFPNNTVKRFTIVPKDPPEPLIPEQFIDTLISFNEKSLSLNWIITQSITDKYNNYLNNAKSALQQNKTVLARCYLQDILRDVDIDSSTTISSEAYALLRYNTEYLISKLPPVSGMIVRLTDSNGDILTGGALQYYEGSWKNAENNQDGTFIVNTNFTKVSLRMTYAYGSQILSNVNVGNDIITFKTINAIVQLKNSRGNLIDNGTVQYYAGGWRNFGSTTNGVATKELLAGNYSFRMTYAYASADKSQNLDTNSTVVFTTINTQVELKNSEGQVIDGGEVQYYSGGWRVFGTSSGGVSQKELLPNTYSFRMTYGYGSNDKQQNTAANPIVIFNTVKTNVELRDSRNNLIDQGTVQYYSGGWRELGTTQDGIVSKELLPNNYSFRMSYAYASNDKQQNIGTNPTVVFQTVNTTVELRNSQNNLMGEGTVQYYSGGWRSIGTTTGGQVSRELLPNNYSFRMTHEYITLDKAQNIGTSNVVTFNTLLCRVRVRDSQNQPINNATIRYYAGAWRNFGTTVNGEVTKEFLPNNLTFRAIVGTQQQDKTQNLLTNPLVEFTF